MVEKGKHPSYYWSLIDIQTPVKASRTAFQRDHKEEELAQIILHGKSVDDFDKGEDFSKSKVPPKFRPARSAYLNPGIPETAIGRDVRTIRGLSPKDNARESVDEKSFPLLETFGRALEQKKMELVNKRRRLEPSEPGRIHDMEDFLEFLEDQLNFTRDNAGWNAVMPTRRKTRISSRVNEEIPNPGGRRDQTLEDNMTYDRPATYLPGMVEDDPYSEKDLRGIRAVPSARPRSFMLPTATIPPRDNTRPSYSDGQGWQGTETGFDIQRSGTDQIYKRRSYERLRPQPLQIQASPAKSRHERNRGKIDDYESKRSAQQRQAEWHGWPGRRQGRRDSSLQHPSVSFGEDELYGKESSSKVDYSKALVRRGDIYENPRGWPGWNGPVPTFHGESHSNPSPSTNHYSAIRVGSVRQQYGDREHKGEAPQNNRFTERERDYEDQDERERSTEGDENEISDTEIIKRTLKKFTTFNANELPSRQARGIYPIVIPGTDLGNTAQSQGNTSAGQQERNASTKPYGTKRAYAKRALVPWERNMQEGGSDTRQAGGISDHEASEPPFEARDAIISARGRRLLQFEPPVPQENGEDWHSTGAEVASPVSVSVRSSSPQDKSQVQESPKRRSTADDLD